MISDSGQPRFSPLLYWQLPSLPRAIGPDLKSLSWLAILVFVLGVVVPGVIIFFPLKDHFAFGLDPQGILENRERAETSTVEDDPKTGDGGGNGYPPGVETRDGGSGTQKK
ncbi:MAG TPA: hypothetical protein VFR75_01625 [Solirubrobacterales bacterium]|nr:hypothetical protein [Solirubrobacterales bacterium]